MNVDGACYRLLGTRDGFSNLEVNLQLAVLVLEDPVSWGRLLGATNLGETPVSLRHGLNTHSLLGDSGSWIVCGPWPSMLRRLVDQAIDMGGVVGSASIARQWRYGPGGPSLLANRLVPEICRQIPNWIRLPVSRQNRIREEMAHLVEVFLSEGPVLPMSSDDPELDTYPGRARVPMALIRDCKDLEAAEVESAQGQADLSVQTALWYWWQSVFTMWWKGFW